jgi:PilZ domain
VIAAKGGRVQRAQQFFIECPVTVTVRARGAGRALQGKLHDIGVSAARFYLSEPLDVGTRLTLDAHFPSDHAGTTTVRFEGVVTGSRREPQHEISVRFPSAGKFVRGDLAKLLKPAKDH